ncbi:GbsR/MarR family transcriptional regulator [Nocardioides sp.]|uniref:GbsR/MarR family transcriptional regulator n=1 Tax=Nocardioides sp. TaxID=35761 RepID=UPI002733BF31|nr:MarR family transcriptional regulator [Nocardioides sp.]MDP3892819.1 MarR family transcriptional regulator [Nocardioides sp.]
MISEDRLHAAVERVGMTLESVGMSRMSARVFAYVLAEDSDRYTARELAEGLRASPAAISGAVRALVDARLLIRERAPGGGRGDIFRVVDDDVWATILSARIPLIEHLQKAVGEAVEMLDDGSPGRRRLEQTRDFFEFSQQDMAGMPARWAAYQRNRPR